METFILLTIMVVTAFLVRIAFWLGNKDARQSQEKAASGKRPVSRPGSASDRRNRRPEPARDQKQRTKPAAGFKTVNVEHVIDGDTVIVSTLLNSYKIRLDAIDCPEDGQHWGDIAKYGLIKLIGGCKVYLEEHGTDYHGRTLATVYVDQRATSELLNVNERMVTLGHAWVMRRYYGHLPKHRRDQLNRLERWARSNKVGLWKTTGPVPPWRWRKNKQASC